MSSIVTFKKLRTEGVLTLGDVLSHSTKPGDWTVAAVYADGTLLVSQGEQLEKWKLDMPTGYTVREVQRRTS